MIIPVEEVEGQCLRSWSLLGIYVAGTVDDYDTNGLDQIIEDIWWSVA